jgi:hypothetical protein
MESINVTQSFSMAAHELMAVTNEAAANVNINVV